MPAALPFTLELLALTSVVCGAHAVHGRLGRAPLFVLLGALIVILFVAGTGPAQLSTALWSTPALKLNTLLFLPPLLAGFVAVYALDGTIAARRLVVALGLLYVLEGALRQVFAWHAAHPAPGFAEATQHAFLAISLHSRVASFVAVVVDVVTIVAVFQLWQNRARGWPLVIGLALGFILAMVSDAFVFDLVRHGSVSSIPLREKIEAGVVAAVPLSGYLGVQLARQGAGRDRGVLELVDLRARVTELEACVSQIRDSFSRYVSPQVVDRLLKDPSQLELGGELREVTVLFADVRGYSTLSEKLDPREVMRLLNAYFAEVGAAVLEHDGMISEFEGDGILAVFGAPVALPDHALRAVRCGEEMLRRVEALNVRWRNDGTARHFDAVGLVGLGTRVGIHSGTVVAGNIGTGARIKYAVVGDAVNTAARIEALVKTLGERMLFSSDTLALLGDSVAARPCGSHAVKGRSQPVTVFTTTASAAPTTIGSPMATSTIAAMTAAPETNAGSQDAGVRDA